MNKKIKKYLRFWFLIDFVGLGLGVFLAGSYLTYYKDFPESIQNLWSNLTIEIIGVWLSVRIIDFLIQRNKNFKQTRFYLLRNFSYFIDNATDVLTYGVREKHIEILDREILHFNIRWEKRKKQFYSNEIELIEQLKNIEKKIIENCRELLHYSNEGFAEVDYLKVKNKLSLQITDFRVILEELRQNIWEESHPDD
ncbi:hypothetical protein ASF10_20395 [Flavobacterium sp. Leaf82]|uniref:hypothetical protein n=1 Tax=unclassified Flavobacterium TaxID=196869 RepID=UPI0006F73775|nr:hypothetical protein [Flavobacterium sp. Leaf82]KQO32815.1 hypothetical protein ASF10_20395 [Flavobacterium sp. Leaf82]